MVSFRVGRLAAADVLLENAGRNPPELSFNEDVPLLGFAGSFSSNDIDLASSVDMIL